MSDPSEGTPRPGPQEFVRGASPQMLKTVGLLLAAFIIGVVMLNVIDPDGNESSTTKPPKTTTTTTAPDGETTTTGGTTATTSAQLVPPAQLSVIVVNASGVSGAAGRVSDAIRTKGYTKQEKADTLAQKRKGSAVQCRAGLDREAAALAKQVANASKVEPFPATLPKLASGKAIPATVQCIVTIGTVA